MDVKIETVGPCKKKVRIELPATTVDAEFEKNYRELNQTVVVPGFRRGKAPRRLMERKFGEQVTDQVKATLLTETLQEALEGHDIHPISEPNLDVESIKVEPKSALVLEFEVEVRPEFELGAHTGIEVERLRRTVSDEEVESSLSDLARRHAEEYTADEGAAIERGDKVIVDLRVEPVETERHGHQVEPYVDENLAISILSEEAAANVVGQGYFPPEAFVGKKRGEEVRGKFPDESHGDHAHPGPEWTAKIKEVKRFKLPAIDDEFAKEMDCADLAELRTKIREELQRRYETQEDQAVEQRILEKLVEAHEIELPESFVEHAMRDRQDRRRFDLGHLGLTKEQIEETITESRDEDDEVLRRELKASLILDRIAEEQGINVTEDEVDARIEKIAHRQRRWPSEIRNMLENEGLIENLRRELRIEKSRVFLRENAKVETRDAPAEPEPAAAGAAPSKGKSKKK